MELRRMENLGVETSLLGFGCMRFPTDADGKIDRPAASALLELAIRNGVNYIDTAYPYHNGESEPFLGEALAKYPRDSYFLATKLPAWALETPADVERIFNEQLARLQTDYIDFYLLHALDAAKWKKLQEFGAVEFCEKMKKAGKIRYFGFSFHDSLVVFRAILSTRDWDFCQLQINYMDTETQAGLEGYREAAEHGVPVVVMEPVKGGLLAKLPKDISARLASVTPDRSDASWAMRYVGSLPNVKVILSGMSDASQVQDNLATFDRFEPLSETEREAIDEAVAIMKARIKNPCTGCRYCMPCPAGVDIPRNFRVWNSFGIYENTAVAADGWRNIPESARADACVACGACLEKCPQRIEIPDDLRRVREAAEAWR